MTPADRLALKALDRRLTHTAAIAHLIGRENDTMIADAVRGVAVMLDGCSEILADVISKQPHD